MKNLNVFYNHYQYFQIPYVNYFIHLFQMQKGCKVVITDQLCDLSINSFMTPNFKVLFKIIFFLNLFIRVQINISHLNCSFLFHYFYLIRFYIYNLQLNRLSFYFHYFRMSLNFYYYLLILYLGYFEDLSQKLNCMFVLFDILVILLLPDGIIMRFIVIIMYFR